MARGKSTFIYLVCRDCGNQNYNSIMNKRNNAKVELKKFCTKCGKHVLHGSKEVKS